MNVGYAPAQQRVQKAIVVQPDQPDIIVNVPEQDNTVLWVGMVVVPLIIACVGWWLRSRRQQVHGRSKR